MVGKLSKVTGYAIFVSTLLIIAKRLEISSWYINLAHQLADLPVFKIYYDLFFIAQKVKVNL